MNRSLLYFEIELSINMNLLVDRHTLQTEIHDILQNIRLANL